MEMQHQWPFEEFRNVIVFTTKSILERKLQILYMYLMTKTI